MGDNEAGILDASHGCLFGYTEEGGCRVGYTVSSQRFLLIRTLEYTFRDRIIKGDESVYSVCDDLSRLDNARRKGV